MGPSGQPPANISDDEIIPDRSDALEFEPVVRARRKSHLGMFLGLLVLAGGSAGGAWYFYGEMLLSGGGGNIPVIRALDGPVKVRPENPGGMAVPDRDKLVYERLKGGGDDLRVERLLPLPETPMAPPAPVKQVAEPIVNPATIPKIEKSVKSDNPPVEIVKTSPVEIKKKPKPIPAPPVAVAAASSAKIYRIQLAAVRSKESADSEWKRLNKKNSDLLGNLTLNVVRVDLGADKGVFYRLRAGPLASEVTARKLCDQLSARKIGCLIVRPGG